MAVMPLPNYSLKICDILQFDCLRVRVYSQSRSHHIPFVDTLVLRCLSFCFPFVHGKLIHVAFLTLLLDIVVQGTKPLGHV